MKMGTGMLLLTFCGAVVTMAVAATVEEGSRVCFTTYTDGGRHGKTCVKCDPDGVKLMFRMYHGYRLQSVSVGMWPDCDSVPTDSSKYQKTVEVSTSRRVKFGLSFDEIGADMCGASACYVFEGVSSKGSFEGVLEGRDGVDECYENVDGILVCPTDLSNCDVCITPTPTPTAVPTPTPTPTLANCSWSIDSAGNLLTCGEDFDCNISEIPGAVCGPNCTCECATEHCLSKNARGMCEQDCGCQSACNVGATGTAGTCDNNVCSCQVCPEGSYCEQVGMSLFACYDPSEGYHIQSCEVCKIGECVVDPASPYPNTGNCFESP